MPTRIKTAAMQALAWTLFVPAIILGAVPALMAFAGISLQLAVDDLKSNTDPGHCPMCGDPIEKAPPGRRKCRCGWSHSKWDFR